ncbi:MAG: hypothetical protein EOP87_16365 [Verrucomicrobiaceae bacterium]|nr:MAG: hypothetical protein EOP87_16365 [Verrucomicrobiaceae bacterium]
MKAVLTIFAAGLALVLTSATARGEFEMWKNKEGKAAELEIADVEEGAGGTQVHFRTKAGKAVTLKLEDLAADDQGRVKDWKKKPPLTATFAYVKSRPNAADPYVQFVFDLKGGIALSMHASELSNIKATVGGQELVVRHWTCIANDGSQDDDPFTQGPNSSERKWSLVVAADGSFGDVKVEECEFSADAQVPCGKSPKEVSALFRLPTGPFQDDEVEKALDPLTVTLGASMGPASKGSGKKVKKEEEAEEVVTGYHIMAGKTARNEDGNLSWDYSPVIHRAFVVNGKEYPARIDKDKATNPIKVVVKYWSESDNVPLRLTKAASNKGRTPPKEEEARDGGADPFGG